MEIARERKAEARKLQLELGIQSMATEPVETNETDTQSRHPWWTLHKLAVCFCSYGFAFKAFLIPKKDSCTQRRGRTICSGTCS
jgi:hypothetical protein